MSWHLSIGVVCPGRLSHSVTVARMDLHIGNLWVTNE